MWKESIFGVRIALQVPVVTDYTPGRVAIHPFQFHAKKITMF